MGLREDLERSVRCLRQLDPRIAGGGFLGIVLGSGLAGLVDALDDLVEIPYGEVDGFTAPTVPGHTGTVAIGTLRGKLIVALRGRIHLYEGHDGDTVVHGVRTLALAGASAVVLTNAAGGLHPELHVGDLMMIDDHINLTGLNPLIGSSSLALGPRFPDMTEAWDPSLRAELISAAGDAALQLKRGVYVGVLGPSYETPAEVRMVGLLGGDVVGMSTVFEAIALRQLDCRVAGVSVVSNAAAGTGEPGDTLDHAHVADVVVGATERMTQLLAAFIDRSASWWEAA